MGSSVDLGGDLGGHAGEVRGVWPRGCRAGAVRVCCAHRGLRGGVSAAAPHAPVKVSRVGGGDGGQSRPV